MHIYICIYIHTYIYIYTYRGMLVFPVVSPQVNMLFVKDSIKGVISGNSRNESERNEEILVGGRVSTGLATVDLASTGLATSGRVSTGLATVDLASTGLATSDRVSTGLATIFPDWVCTLQLRLQEDGDVKGDKNDPPLVVTLAMHVIASYYPVLLCNRLTQGQPLDTYTSIKYRYIHIYVYIYIYLYIYIYI
jgi:hypothetical protein